MIGVSPSLGRLNKTTLGVTSAMLQQIKKLLVLLPLILITGCGGDGFSGSKEADDATAADNVASVTLLASSPQLLTGDGEGITLTTIIKDASNNLLKDKTVSFSSDSGALVIVSGTTDSSGKASAKLTTGGNEANRAINITATSGSVSSTIGINAAGTTIKVSGESALVLGDQTVLTLTLKDSFGNGLAKQVLTVSSTLGNTLDATTLETNSAGEAQVKVTGTVSGGSDTIRVTGLGASASFSLTVSADSFKITSPSNNGAEVAIGTSQPITVTWMRNNAPITGQTINISATRGALNASSAVTNAEGKVSFTLTSTNAGFSTIIAAVDNGPTAQRTVEFVATNPVELDLQTEYSSVGPGGDQSTIIATVRDINKNLVKNKKILFSVNDVTGGQLSTPTATTDSSGQASTVYTSGSSVSAKDGVVITATVQDAVTVTNSVNLTVANRALFITVGTGNSVEEPNSSYYSLPYSVYVTDADGNGVANAEVLLSMASKNYHKGWYNWGGKVWEPFFTVSNCVNEDINTNGMLDTGEDNNNDGLLTPGNKAAVESKVTTDASGFATFKITYAQQYAIWLTVGLEARARVAGTESLTIQSFRLPIAPTDISDEKISPPGQPSPFGTSGFCTDTN